MPHILIVLSDYYHDIATHLLNGAEARLAEAKATHEVVRVPGAFEIPAAIHMALHAQKYDAKKYDGFVALGCVIRGETTHYDYVCGESARALMDLSVLHQAAIGYGILTVEDVDQAEERANPNLGNKGGEAVEACLTMAALKQHFAAGHSATGHSTHGNHA